MSDRIYDYPMNQIERAELNKHGANIPTPTQNDGNFQALGYIYGSLFVMLAVLIALSRRARKR